MAVAKPRPPAGAALEPPAGTNVVVLKGKLIQQAVEDYAEACRAYNAAEKTKERLKPVIKSAMLGCPLAYSGKRVLQLVDVPEMPGAPDVTVTKSMVGSVIPGKPGRRGYQQLTVV